MKQYDKIDFMYSKPITKGKGFEIMRLEDKFLKLPISRISTYKRIGFYTIYIITSGKMVIDIDFQTFALTEGSVALCSVDRIFRYIESNDTKGYMILFTEDYLFEFMGAQSQMILELFETTYFTPLIADTNVISDILYPQFDLLHQIFVQSNPIFDFNVTTLSFQTLMTILANQLSTNLEEKGNTLFLKFSKLIDDHMNEHKTVDIYAQMLNVTTKTVNQVTRHSVNMSAKEYIIKKLILKIKVYLCFADMTIAEIADELGFSEPYNLSKFFKKYTGQTPTTFRTTNWSV